MSETRPNHGSDRLSITCLIGLTAWMVVVRWGALASGSSMERFQVIAGLVGIWTLYLFFWKNSGSFYAILSSIIFITSIGYPLDTKSVSIWHINQIIIISILGISVLAGPRKNQPTRSVYWLLATLAFVLFAVVIWLETPFVAVESVASAAVSQRSRVATLVMMIAVGLIGGFSARATARGWVWLLLCLLSPAIGFALASLKESITAGDVMTGLRFDQFLAIEWDSNSLNELLQRSAAWCWAPPLFVLPLMLIGFWRAIARGLRQHKSGEAPLAWLLVPMSVLLLATLLPTPDERMQPVGLIWLGILLSVFAIADLLLLLFEKLALPVPPSRP